MSDFGELKIRELEEIMSVFNGQEIQKLNHVIWRCQMWDIQRNELIKKMVKNKNNGPYDIREYLCKPDIVAMEMIHHFLRECNIKI